MLLLPTAGIEPWLPAQQASALSIIPKLSFHLGRVVILLLTVRVALGSL